MNNYYDVLGVSKDATKEEIKKAYKSLVKKYHPDIYKGEDREERFKEIQKAYETLYDDAKRSQYDNVGHSGYEDQQRYQSGYSSYRDVHGFNDFRGYSSVKLKSFKDMKWYWQIIIIVGFIFLIGIIIVVSIIAFIIWVIRQIIKMIFGK